MTTTASLTAVRAACSPAAASTGWASTINFRAGQTRASNRIAILSEWGMVRL